MSYKSKYGRKKKRKRYPCACSKCGHQWKAYSPTPRMCPACQRRDWNGPPEERKEVANPGMNGKKASSARPARKRTWIEKEYDRIYPDGWHNPAEAIYKAQEEAELAEQKASAKKLFFTDKEKKWIQKAERKKLRQEAKAQKRLDRLERKSERRRTRTDKRSGSSRKSKAPRMALWSETHPRGWKTASNLLPRLHSIALVLLITYAIMTELTNGNYDFMEDWYRGSVVLPAIVEITSSQQAFEQWLNTYGIQFFIILTFVITCFLVFYLSVWRACFRNYVKFSEGEPKPEGRCYWRTNNIWTKLWDRAYRSPTRMLNTYWINQGRFFNLLNPSSSLIRLDTGTDEKCEEKGMWKIQVNEKRIRRKVNNSSRHLTTANYVYPNGIIPNDYVEGKFLEMSQKCVDDTTALSFANPSTRNSVMQSGLRLLTPGIREAILEDRRQRTDNN